MTTITLSVKDGKDLYKTGCLFVNKRLLSYDSKNEYYTYYNEDVTKKEIVRVLIQSGIRHPRVEVNA